MPNKNEMIDKLKSLGIKNEHALLLYDYAKGLKELKYFVETSDTEDIIDFGNKITPPNWILHPRGPVHELKPGTLYVEVIIPDPEYCEEIFEDTEEFSWVDLPMVFIKLSDLADTGDKRAKIALKEYGDGIIAQISMTLCPEIHVYATPQFILVHELAHIVDQRYLSHKFKAWRGFRLPPSRGKMKMHGLIYQWAYDLLIKRVEKIQKNEIGKLVVNECRKDLETIQEEWAIKIEVILQEWSEHTINFRDKHFLKNIKDFADKELDFVIKSIEPYFEF